MTLEITLIAVLGVALIAAIVVLLLRQGGGASEEMARIGAQQGELAGRLAQLADQTTAMQGLIAEQLQSQERQVSKTLGERLDEVTKRLDEGLDKSYAQTAQTIGDLRERLAVIQSAQENIARLSTQVSGLQEILANKQARGAFGEVQLENLVKSVLPPRAYQFQAPVGAGKRVDCKIELPNPPGPICIDAKFPLESYRLLRAAEEDGERSAALRALGQAVSVHVQDIAAKYIVPGETAEGALMFLPSEAIYAELHASLPEVVEKANRAKVYIVSPTTLWAVLHTLRAILKDVEMREQAGRIQQEVALLMRDVNQLDERVTKLGRHFDQAQEDVRQVRQSTEKIVKRATSIGEVQLEDQAAAPPIAQK